MVGDAPSGLRAGVIAFTGLMLLFLLAPLVVVMAASVSAGGYLVFPPQGLSLRWYEAIFADRRYIEAAWTSLRVAVATTVIAVPIGTAAAIGLSQPGGRWRGAYELLFLSPLLLPTILLAIGLMIVAANVFGGSSVVWLVIGHVVLALPYVVRTVGAVIQGIDPATEEAARVMGARWWQRLTLVTLPQCKSGIFAGAFLAFLVSFDDAVLILFLRTPTIDTVPLRIYASLEFSPDPGVAAASTCLILIAAVTVLATERLLGGRRVVG